MPWLLYPQEGPGTYYIRGLVGPRVGLDGFGKSRPPPGFDPRLPDEGQNGQNMLHMTVEYLVFKKLHLL
jgi:hypothetical protein